MFSPAEARQTPTSRLLPIPEMDSIYGVLEELPARSIDDNSIEPKPLGRKPGFLQARFGRPWFGRDSRADDGSFLGGSPNQWLPRLPIPEFIHSDPDDPLKHVGKGNPLVGTSWLNRPYHFDLFMGGLFGGQSVNGRIDQGNDFFSGVRLGWDFDHYWGGETRFAFGTVDTFDTQNPQFKGESENEFLDVHLLYYPWGDAAMRPYFSLGMGIARFNFVDDRNLSISEGQFSLPLGMGFKYHMSNWWSLRFDLMDNVIFGSTRVAGMHNFSISGGTEIRFGGRRRSYFPYHK